MSSPRRLFRAAAVAEAVTWALLLFGMFLKYVTETTEVGVRVFGLLHGIVFVGFCLVTVLVAIDQRWSAGRLLLGLVSAVPPFATVGFDAYAERRGWLADSWRLLGQEQARAIDRPVAWLLHHPGRGAIVGVVAAGVLTGLALAVGPPA
ncbi:MAG: DUF3817 domain-containing protein [Nocardioides sp.]